MFVKTFALIESSFTLFDGESLYDEWQDQKGATCMGMRNRETGKKHGIMRKVWPNEAIWDICYRHGKSHGLTIQYQEKCVHVFLYKDGERLADFAFDH